jgi:hypothetical protein
VPNDIGLSEFDKAHQKLLRDTGRGRFDDRNLTSYSRESEVSESEEGSGEVEVTDEFRKLVDEVNEEVVQGVRLTNRDGETIEDRYSIPAIGCDTVFARMTGYMDEMVLDPDQSYPTSRRKGRKRKSKKGEEEITSSLPGRVKRRGCASCGIRDVGVVSPDISAGCYTDGEYGWKTIPVDSLDQYIVSESYLQKLNTSKYKDFHTFSVFEGNYKFNLQVIIITFTLSLL